MRVVGICFFCLYSFIFSQFSSVPYDQLLDTRINSGSQKDMLEKMQAVFIQELFVKQLFETPEIIEFEEDPIYDTRESNQLMNTMYARELSKILASQDLLNLNSLMR